MGDTLEPRPVRVRDIRDWLKESADLFRRRLLFFVCLSLAFHYLAWSSRIFGVPGLVLATLICQVFVALSIFAAHAADNTRPISLRTMWITVRNIIWYLVLLTLLYVVIFVLAMFVGQYLDFNLTGVDYTAKPLYQSLRWLFMGQFAFIVILSCIVITSFWFLNPLIALHSLKLRDAIRLARRAESKNILVVFVASYPLLLGALAIDLVSELGLFANIFLIPLFGIYQYVSYRHVFLGKKENAPVPVAEEVAVADEVQARQVVRH